MDLAGDGYVHCLGASDERALCTNAFPHEPRRRFLCNNSLHNTINMSNIECVDVTRLCDCFFDCPNGDDELVCPWLKTIVDAGECQSQKFHCQANKTRPISRLMRCDRRRNCLSKEDEILCDLITPTKEMKYFQVKYLPEYASSLLTIEQRKILGNKDKSVLIVSKSRYCHRGMLLYDSLDNPLCLCPPAYYGSHCQYQNERITVLFRLRKISAFEPLLIFRVVVMLMDESNGGILSHEQIVFAPHKDCQPTYIIYLLYPLRPKNRSKNYSVRIDAFSIHIFQNEIRFRASYTQEIPFNFLPVYRIAMDLIIPLEVSTQISSCSLPCKHGRCKKYINAGAYYCHCDSNWSGKFCTEKYDSSCASGAVAIDQKICVCPIGRIGRRCFAPVVVCLSSPCVNGGICLPFEHPNWLHLSYRCHCKPEYFGSQCQLTRSRLVISTRHMPPSPSFSIRIHLIYTQSFREPTQDTILQSLDLHNTSVTILVERTPDLVFLELDKEQIYLMLILQPSVIDDLGAAAPVKNISLDLIPTNQCPHISGLLSSELLSDNLLRRIKYYQRPCREHPLLRCFYDETRMCLCTHQNSTDCFRFDLKTKFECYGYNYCRNGGRCYQSDPALSGCISMFMCRMLFRNKMSADNTRLFTFT